jgi:hypothetical protein
MYARYSPARNVLPSSYNNATSTTELGHLTIFYSQAINYYKQIKASLPTPIAKDLKPLFPYASDMHK